MRPLAVYLTLLALLLVSVGAGFLASDWPQWCSRVHWCSGQWRPPAPRQFRPQPPRFR